MQKNKDMKALYPFLMLFILIGFASCESSDDEPAGVVTTTLPIASFYYETYNINSTTARVTFTNTSAYSARFEWSFNNGTTLETDSMDPFDMEFTRPPASATTPAYYDVVLIAYSDTIRNQTTGEYNIYDNTFSKRISVE